MALAVAEVAMTAAELLDVGWSKLMRSKTRREQVQEQEALEDRALTLEGELAKEKVETRKLHAAIEEYKQLLLKLHRDRGIPVADTDENDPSEEVRTAELMFQVEQKINSPEFLDHLLAPPGAVVMRGDGGGPSRVGFTSGAGITCSDEGSKADFTGEIVPEATPATRATSSGGHIELCIEPDEDSECWQWVTAREMRGGIRLTSEPCSGLEGEEDYELVEGDDVVDGISSVLARFIASHPEYKGLSAEELQKAISAGFKDLKGRGLMRALWNWSKFTYKASRWAAATYNVYRHPLMVRAVLLALVSSTRLVFGFRMF